MKAITVEAHAKINLTLDVTGIRPDGYHNLCSVMQELDLCDIVTMEIGTGEGYLVETQSGSIPADDTNLAVKGAKAFYLVSGIEPEPIRFIIEKRNPVCAGLGGGSADAAAVMCGLQEYYNYPLSRDQMIETGSMVGADVPFALFGGTALAEETGYALQRLPDIPECEILLVKPDYGISTPELYREIDRWNISRRPDTQEMLRAIREGDLRAVGDNLYNVFTPIVAAKFPEIMEIIHRLQELGALGVSMSGSGSTIFGIFSSVPPGAADELRFDWNETIQTAPRRNNDNRCLNPKISAADKY